MASAGLPLQREIRVFISSTFVDMHEEREELVKQVFPQLRRLCENRGVTWGEVDLRWGVPNEASADGSVLPLCLAEIERCRPYFIGLLGERYGWVPEEISPELLRAQPWLNHHRKQSVTALEMLHGVLLKPELAKYAFFYLRDPSCAAARRGFSEIDAERRERLATLKADIRASGAHVAENFVTPKQLGEWVLRDLTAVIESLYPESNPPEPLDRAAADHEAYAANRHRLYISRAEYKKRLDAHAAGEGPPLVVLGESGVGKSALLANWADGWRKQHPTTAFLLHFIGASPDSADWMAMLRRFLGEFRRLLGVEIEIPDRPDALRMVFADALQMVAAHGRTILVLDALDQIEDRDGAPDLLWLPRVMPAGVRLIVSTLSGRPLDAITERNWESLEVKPLFATEREALIANYLKQYGKELSPERVRRIVEAKQSGNGLYLTTLLNELRLFGTHEELDGCISRYLDAANPFELYGKVIARWDQDYNQRDSEYSDVVRESLSRIWAARRGLSETELLQLLGRDDAPLPRAVWAPLSLAIGGALVNRGGLLTFAHDFLREAVRQAYLPMVNHQQDAHRILAEYFDAQPQGPRQLDELPWQWQEAAEWLSLVALLTQPGFFNALWDNNEFEVKAYWARIEAKSPLRIKRAYAAVIETFASSVGHAWRIGILLADSGNHEEALRLRRAIAEHYKKRGDYEGLSAALSGQALILHDRGDLDGAMFLSKEQERICRELDYKPGLQAALGNQANILDIRGDLDGSMALHQETERLSRELGDKATLAISLGNQALILYARGDLDGAMSMQKEKERLCRELGNRHGLQVALGNQARILYARGDLNRAMTRYEEVERISHELGDKTGLEHALGGQALILRDRGDHAGAIALFKEQERLCRELGSKGGLASALGNQALILRDREDLDGAMILLKEHERLCRELGDKSKLASSLGNQALILRDREDLDGAMAVYLEAERVFRELGEKDGIISSLGNQAGILQDRGDVSGALALLREVESLCRELGKKNGLQQTLGYEAVILSGRGDLDGAIALFEQQEQLCRELGNPEGLATSLANQALIHSRTPVRRGEARRLVDEALAIAIRHSFRSLATGIMQLRDSIERGG